MNVTAFSEPGSIEQDGGKGLNLKRLTQSGFTVPEGVVLDAGFYKNHYPLPPAFDYEHTEKLEAQCAAMKAVVMEIELPQALVAQLQRFLDGYPESARFAVRSSSTFEDLGTAAFAGQHDTFLNLAKGSVFDKIKRCLASLWQPHAVLYRNHHGFAQEQASMAVVIQRMVPAQASGVAFSVDPVTGRLEQALIEGNWGVGESVVGGEAATDTWVVDTQGWTIAERRIQEKEYALIADETGIAKVMLEGDKRSQPCLTDDQILEIARLSKNLMSHYEQPQDIEWAYENGQLYVLQSRPQTTIPPHFTRDESAERFPDPLTPLTWSYVQEAFNHSLEYSLRLMRLDLPTRPWFELIDHYVYGNQNAVALLGLLRPIKATNFDELLQEIPELRKRYQWVIELPQQWLRDLDKYLIEIGMLSRPAFWDFTCADFQDYFKRLFSVANAYFQPNIAISMTQAFLTKTLFGVIRLLVDDELEAHDYLKKIIAISETKTGQINRELYLLAMTVKDDEALQRHLTPGAFNELGDLDAFPDFQKRLKDFLDNYGHREMSFDYYHPTWVENPKVVIDLIMLTASMSDEKPPDEIEHALRRQQLEATRKLYSRTPAELHFFLHELIRLTVNFTFLDDLEHFQTTRLNLLARKTVFAFGSRLQAVGDLDDPYDLFFLTRREIETVETFQLSPDLKSIIRERKSSFVAATKTQPQWDLQETEQAKAPAGNVLQGVPGSPGECQGQVYLVHRPEDFSGMPDRAILVARTTNPAWTPLFYKASAVITESGGPLSHGAVTARELGLPAVMCVRNCMSLLQNGQAVSINGRHGIVQLLAGDKR